MTPSIAGSGTHPRLQWVTRGSPAITLTEALHDAIPVDVLDNTVVDADAYYHQSTDTLIVVQFDTVQTVLNRNEAPLRCPHGKDPASCHKCTAPDHTVETVDQPSRRVHEPTPTCL